MTDQPNLHSGGSTTRLPYAARDVSGRFMVVPVVWRVGPQEDPFNGYFETRVESCIQRDGSVLYAVRRLGRTLNKGGEWELEPIPSDRDTDYIARCRWSVRANAEDAAQKALGREFGP